MKAKKTITVIAIIGIFISLLTYWAYFSQQSHSLLSEDDLRRFSEIFLKTYREQVERNFREKYRRYFDFYVDFPFIVNITISKVHGAAIEFTPSNKQAVKFQMTNETIEFAVFRDINLNITRLDVNATVFIFKGSSGPMFYVNGSDILVEDIIFITNRGYLLKLANTGSVLFRNVIVDGRYCYLVLLKGSNSRGAWSDDAAKNDALLLFKNELYKAFNKSEEIRKYIAYPELKELVAQIVWKLRHADEIGYDLFSFKDDLARVQRIAVEKYRISSEFVDEILDYIEQIEPQPPFWEVPPWSWIFGGIVGVIIAWVFGKLKEKISAFRKKGN